jgi:endogenous inhibitor of DNA gyrase (YacG/DUF329 family)
LRTKFGRLAGGRKCERAKPPWRPFCVQQTEQIDLNFFDARAKISPSRTATDLQLSVPTRNTVRARTTQSAQQHLILMAGGQAWPVCTCTRTAKTSTSSGSSPVDPAMAGTGNARATHSPGYPDAYPWLTASYALPPVFAINGAVNSHTPTSPIFLRARGPRSPWILSPDRFHFMSPDLLYLAVVP